MSKYCGARAFEVKLRTQSFQVGAEMNKQAVIVALSSINFICKDENEGQDRETFEPIIKSNPKVGLECLKIWMSKYYVSLTSKALIDRFEQSPTWENFHLASHFLMVDRIIAAVALDGNVTSQVAECIDLTLKCGNIDLETLMWVEFYANATPAKMAV